MNSMQDRTPPDPVVGPVGDHGAMRRDGAGHPGLGDRVAVVIDTVTLGWGKALARRMARTLGYEDCGGERRRRRLNRYGRTPVRRGGRD